MSKAMAIGVSALVVIGAVAIIGVAVWNEDPHHGTEGRDAAPENGAAAHRMHGHEGHAHGEEHTEEETNPEDGAESADQMGAHHQTHAHHDLEDAESGPEALELSGTVEDGVRVVEMTARQFAFDPSTVVVETDQPVRLEVTSEDVTHGIDLEGFGIDKHLPPKKTVTIEFTADKPGQHHFHCSVFCGKGHDKMHGTLVVRDPGGE